MEWIEVKRILKKNEEKDFSFVDYVFDIYEGCDQGCIYCDSRSHCFKIKEFDVVKQKKDFLLLLNKELRHKKKKGILGIGLLSDPYNSLEKEEKITLQTLKLIQQYGFGVVIHTKNDLILRDLDVLKKINERNVVMIDISISSFNDEISKKIEPFASLPSKRFEIIQKCKEAGLICGISLKPVLPFISDQQEDLQQLIDRAGDCQADYILTDMKVTLRDRQREYYYKKLDELFPGLSFQYRRIYNNRYHCETLHWKVNYELLKRDCLKKGICYLKEDIEQWIKKKDEEYEQISLFD